MQILLDHNANVNVGGGAYGSALQAAVCRGKLDTVQLLLDHNANVNIGGGVFGSALQAAAYGVELEFVQLLLQPERGANIHARGCYGNALQAAALRDNQASLEITKLLLSRGVEVDQPGEE